jgi:hypothetical protein
MDGQSFAAGQRWPAPGPDAALPLKALREPHNANLTAHHSQVGLLARRRRIGQNRTA